MTRIRSALLGVVFVATAFHGATGQKLTGPHSTAPVPSPVLLDTTGLFLARFAKVGDDMFIGGQPTEGGLREVARLGVTTVVNLRTPAELTRDVPFDEPALVRQLGMTYVYLPVRGDTVYPYSPATVKQFADAMAEAKGKVLLHCTVAWRASNLWAAYLIADRGMAEDSALANARAINLGDGDRRMSSGRQPVEQFLDRDLTKLRRPKP